MSVRRLDDPAAVRAAVDQIASEYAEKGKPLHVLAVAYALDCDMDTLKKYERGDNIPRSNGGNEDDVERAQAITAEVQRAYRLCKMDLGDTLMEHGGNNGAIFMAKCCHGMQDTIKVEVSAPTFSGDSDV